MKKFLVMFLCLPLVLSACGSTTNGKTQSGSDVFNHELSSELKKETNNYYRHANFFGTVKKVSGSVYTIEGEKGTVVQVVSNKHFVVGEKVLFKSYVNKEKYLKGQAEVFKMSEVIRIK